MKKLLKGAAAVLLAAVMACGGYIAGQRTQLNSQVSAIPKEIHGKIEGDIIPVESPALEEAVFDKAEMPKEGNIAETREIKKSEKSGAESSWTKVDQSYNTPGLGTITLYTSAQKEDGEILWDDSQKWLVEVSDGNGGYYTLYDQYVTNGSVYYDISEKESGEKLINVYTMTSAGTTIMQYTYSDEKFTEKTVYNSGSVNRMFATFPSYR